MRATSAIVKRFSNCFSAFFYWAAAMIRAGRNLDILQVQVGGMKSV